MSARAAVLAIASVATIGLSYSAVAAYQAERSVWDGVYTEDQAKRGEPMYQQYCASCHGPDMSGGEMAPGLAGGEFSSNWNDLTLGQLFDRMRTSMPQNNPGSLSRQQCADILAFILSKGNAPVGKTELPTQSEVLGTASAVYTLPLLSGSEAAPQIAETNRSREALYPPSSQPLYARARNLVRPAPPNLASFGKIAASEDF